MPMRTMHRVNGLMLQDLLRYEKKAREMTKLEHGIGWTKIFWLDSDRPTERDKAKLEEALAAPLTPAGLEDVIKDAWETLEGHGFPPEACSYLPAAIDNAITALTGARDDLLAEVQQLRAQVESARAKAIEECVRVASCYSPSPWDAERMRAGIIEAIRKLSVPSTEQSRG